MGPTHDIGTFVYSGGACVTSSQWNIAGMTFLAEDRRDGYWQQICDGVWEPSTVVALSRLQPGDLFVDVGAFVGATTLLAAARGARVIAFEPDPVARRELEANVVLNDFQDRVTIEPVALASRTKTRQLTAPYVLGGGMSSIARISLRGMRDHRAAVVDAVDVRTFLARFEGARLIKVDIEGGEYALLPAMRAWVRRHKPDLMLSLHTVHLEGLINPLPQPLRVVALWAATLLLRGRLVWLPRLYEYRARSGHDDWLPVSSIQMAKILFTPGESEIFLSAK